MIQRLMPSIGGVFTHKPALVEPRLAGSPAAPALLDKQPVGDTVLFGASRVKGRYSPEQLDAMAKQVAQDGYIVLKGHFPKEKLRAWNNIFQPVLQDLIRQGEASERGPNRFYAKLPFTQPFADPAIYADPDILGVVERLLGKNYVMSQFASDTPFEGSEDQPIHSDTSHRSPLMPDWDPVKPFQLAVNFPLVDVTLDNGPFTIIPGTHTWTEEEQKAFKNTPEAQARKIPLTMELGDVMIRDVRTLHQGTKSNTTDPRLTPRTMVVIGYNPREHDRNKLENVYIPILESEHRKIPRHARRMMDVNPVFKRLEDIPKEKYSDLPFLREMMMRNHMMPRMTEQSPEADQKG